MDSICNTFLSSLPFSLPSTQMLALVDSWTRGQGDLHLPTASQRRGEYSTTMGPAKCVTLLFLSLTSSLCVCLWGRDNRLLHSTIKEAYKPIAGFLGSDLKASCRKYPGSTIVTDSVTSNGLSTFIKSLGGKHFRYRRGYKNVIGKGVELNGQGVDCQLMMETRYSSCGLSSCVT